MSSAVKLSALQFVKAKLDLKISVILVMDDPRSRKVLTGWKLYPHPAFQDFSVSATDQPREVLARLWQKQPEVDFTELANICQMPESRVKRIFLSLKSGLTVWPDGTISSHIDSMLLAAAGMGLLPKELRGRAARGGLLGKTDLGS